MALKSIFFKQISGYFTFGTCPDSDLVLDTQPRATTLASLNAFSQSVSSIQFASSTSLIFLQTWWAYVNLTLH